MTHLIFGLFRVAFSERGRDAGRLATLTLVAFTAVSQFAFTSQLAKLDQRVATVEMNTRSTVIALVRSNAMARIP